MAMKIEMVKNGGRDLLHRKVEEAISQIQKSNGLPRDGLAHTEDFPEIEEFHRSLEDLLEQTGKLVAWQKDECGGEKR